MIQKLALLGGGTGEWIYAGQFSPLGLRVCGSCNEEVIVELKSAEAAAVIARCNVADGNEFFVLPPAEWVRVSTETKQDIVCYLLQSNRGVNAVHSVRS